LAGSYEHTFELYSEEGKVYLFGTDDGSIAKNWIRAIAMVIKLFIYFGVFFDHKHIFYHSFENTITVD